MDTRKAIRKIIFTAIIAVAGIAMLTLLVAAISEKKKGQCKDYTITVRSNRTDRFLDDKDVFRLLSAAAGGKVKGQQLSVLNTRKLEAILESNVWISDAQLYFDNRNVLHVAVREREPIARLFTVAGNSFYIDSSTRKMPLSEKASIRVPAFTGFPDKKTLSKKDSLLLADIKRVAQFIDTDPFWSAQTAAIDITSERNFEMTPVVGNHLIKLGDAQNLEKKFHRLFLFYKSVLSKTGFDRYRVIDVQYEEQIVAMRKGGKTNTIDTARLKLNVQKLIKQALEAQNDTMATARPVVAKATLQDPTDNRPALVPVTSGDKSSDPNPLKISVKSNPEKKPAPVKRSTISKPKAVMKKKEN